MSDSQPEIVVSEATIAATEGKMNGMMTPSQFKDLANLSRKLLTAYDVLLEKHNALLKNYAEAEAKMEQESSRREELEEAIEPLCEEYSGLRTKYQSEKTLRLVAETHASKVIKDNKRIKHQSAFLLQKMTAVDIDIDIPDALEEPAEESEDTKDLVAELNQTVSQLQEELTGVQLEYSRAQNENATLQEKADELYTSKLEIQEELQTRERELALVKVKIQQQSKEFTALKRVSAMAYNDYQFLQERYERDAELLRKSTNEEVKIKAEEDKVEEQIKDLQVQIEQIQSEKDIQGRQLQRRIDELQELVDNADEVNSCLPESALSAADVTVLNEKLEASNTELINLRSTNKALEERIAKMEKELNQGSNIPLPPPPPPPPGPPAGIFSVPNFLKSRKRQKKDTLKKVVGEKAIADPNMHNAIQEMMKRINSGTNALKPVQIIKNRGVNSEEKDGEGMESMHNLLAALKKRPKPQPSARHLNPARASGVSTEDHTTPPVPKPRMSLRREPSLGDDDSSNPVPKLKKHKPAVPLPKSFHCQEVEAESELTKKLASQLQKISE